METSVNNGMCRCCASEGTFKDVRSTYHWMGEEEIYADMLKECFDILLSKSEADNAGGICEVCITQLRNAANFKKQVLHTEEQFKKHFHNKIFKPIKLEVSRDGDELESDNNLSDDFSTDFDLPIKEEIEEPKPKKRTSAVKATTSKAKKAKVEGETSVKRVKELVKMKPEVEIKMIKMSQPGRKRMREVVLNQQNLRHILLHSNATPIKGKLPQGYGCTFCPKKFPEPATLKTHTLEEHVKDKVNAWIVNKLFDRVVKLDVTYLTCTLCDTNLDKLDDLMSHLVNEHKKQMHLDVSSHIVPFKFDSEVFCCAVCSTRHSTFKVLLEHMHVHFRNYVCDTCNAGYVNHRQLKEHLRRHGNGEFKCDECGKIFDLEMKLKEHKRRTHLGLDKRSKCPACDERFADYWKRISHMNEVHGIPRTTVKCHACDRTFLTQRHLSRHTRKDHLMERKHKCEECDMSFFGKVDLTKHMVKHTGVRKFRCEVCSKRYARKSTLREHMRIHRDDRRFECAHCGQRFVQKCSWKGHMRSIHGEEVPILNL